MVSVEEYETIAEDEPVTDITKNELENWHSLHRPPKQIRSVRFAYNSTTTSSAPPSQIFMSVHQALVLIQKREPSNRLTFTRVPDLYMLNCEYVPVNADDRIEFEIEVCKLWLLKLHGIRVKRLSGNPFVFKDLYHSLVDFMKL
ncbi:KA1 domain/Ssp2 C-terminal domain-containing protein [Cladochytrium replicatum]|nr:KA1 domain/Ssp2 C-terminal domain-containing protein [Cladochytrium replicatum]